MSVLQNDVFDEGLRVRNQDSSHVLQGHFSRQPIVPGVLLEDIANRANAITSRDGLRSSKTTFFSSVKPGDQIVLVAHEGGTNGVVNNEIRFQHEQGLPLDAFTSPVSLFGVKTDTPATLDAHILQSGDFRFVSGASIDTDGTIMGLFELPENHRFYENGTFRGAILQEAANQIISLAHSKNQNPDGVQQGKTILLKASNIHGYTSVTLQRGKTLFLVGRILAPQEKRILKARYTAFDDNLQSLFSGEITGTEVPTRLLFR